MIDYWLEAYRKVVRRARNRHKCCECLGVIQPGEMYFYHSGIGMDGPESFKICNDCENMLDRFKTHDMDEAIGFTQLCESIFESQELKDIHEFLNTCFRRGSFSVWMVKYANYLPNN